MEEVTQICYLSESKKLGNRKLHFLSAKDFDWFWEKVVTFHAWQSCFSAVSGFGDDESIVMCISL